MEPTEPGPNSESYNVLGKGKKKLMSDAGVRTQHQTEQQTSLFNMSHRYPLVKCCIR